MADLIDEIEARRQVARMSQAEIADALGISQGQYSKVVKRRVALTAKMGRRMRQWLDNSETGSAEVDREILQKCIELMHLIRQRLGIDAAEIGNEPK